MTNRLTEKRDKPKITIGTYMVYLSETDHSSIQKSKEISVKL